jgi:tetratricopeptide (TPR) repeat protein
MAVFKSELARDWRGSEVEFKCAIELNPSLAISHHWYSFYLAAVGRVDECLQEMELARALDPLSLLINADLGFLFYMARQDDRAIEQLRRTIELNPGFALAHHVFGRCYAQVGSFREAIEEFRKAEQLVPDSAMYVAGVGHGYTVSGSAKGAMEVLDRLIVRGKRTYTPAWDIAFLHVGLQKTNQAFAWLERAYGEGSQFYDELLLSPALDPLRAELRFRSRLQRTNLTP